jgi:hypothetical protein
MLEYHIDVGTAMFERRQAGRFDEPWNRKQGLHGPHGRVEALEVPHLKNAVGAARRLDQQDPLLHRHRHRLFDQDMRPGAEKCLCDFEMQRCRRDHADRIHPSQ